MSFQVSRLPFVLNETGEGTRHGSALPKLGLHDRGFPAQAARELDLLADILSAAPSTKLIAMTDADARELAVQAVGFGAADFYHKPISAPCCPSLFGALSASASWKSRTGVCAP